MGPRRALPSGGLLLHRLELLRADLKAGFLGVTARQLLELRRLETDTLVVVGDVYALLLSSLVPTKRRFFVQTLVSAYHGAAAETGSDPPGWRFFRGLGHPNRLFMERIQLPERALMRRLARHVYVRDAATAAFLRGKGLDNVSALGNPALDTAVGGVMLEHRGASNVALLPGSRAYAPAALKTMLLALAQVPGATGLVAWAGETLPPPPAPWSLVPQSLVIQFAATQCPAIQSSAQPPHRGLTAVFTYGEQKVYVYEQRFADVLNTAHLVLGTSGTANEQAAALGKPVVAFPVPPFYTPAFLRNQRRLLGDALTVSEPSPEAIAAALQALFEDDARRAHAGAAGRARLGRPGGTRAIVADLLTRTEL